MSTIAVNALLFRALGTEFGIFALLWTTSRRFDILEDSVGVYLIRLSAAIEDKDDTTFIRQVVTLYLLFTVGAAGLLGLVVHLLLSGHREAGSLAALTGAGLIATAAVNVATRLLEGMERYGFLRIVQAVGSGLLVIAALIVARQDDPDITTALLLSLAVQLVVFIGLTNHRIGLGWQNFTPSAPTRSALLGVFRFSRPLLVAKGSALISYRLDLWIVTLIAGSTATAQYALGESVAQLVARTLEVFRPIVPISARSDIADTAGDNPDFPLRATKFTLGVTLVVASLIFANTPWLLSLFFGEAPPQAVIVARLLIAFYALTAARSPLQFIYMGQGRFGRLEAIFVAAALVNIAGSVSFTVAFGGVGPAWGTLGSGVVLLVAVLRVGIGDGEAWVRPLAIRVVPMALAIAVASVAVALAIDLSSTWATLLARSGVTTALFACGYGAFVINRDDRNALLESIRR